MSNELFEDVKQALVSESVISEDELEKLERDATTNRESIGQALVNSGYISEERLSGFLADKLRMPYVDLKKYSIDPRVLDLIPQKIAHRCGVIPLFLIEDVLTVAISDPLNIVAIDELSSVTGYKVEAVLASSEAIAQAINQWYGVGDQRKDLIDQLSTELMKVECLTPSPASLDEATLRELRVKSEDKELVQFLSSLIIQAILESATDLHFEPQKSGLQVRFRIDGVLFKRLEVPSRQVVPLAVRLKLLAGLDIAKKGVAQCGQARLSVRNQLIDAQVSVFPTLHGDKVVLHISNEARKVPSLSELGLPTGILGEFSKIIQEKRGLILVCGPSGSGKTTTVYSTLKTLAGKDKNIIAIEDPVECEIEGVFQGQVDPRAGVTFAETLNAMLHQDPDVLYIDEIRDFEGTWLAIRAALTGHLVFTTLEANNSFETITHLYDLGINPGLLESVLKCVITQRLVRKICPHCKTEYRPLEKTLVELGLPSGVLFYKGKGCPQCNDSGYKGMTAVYEMLAVTNEIRKVISNFTSDEELMEAAWAAGMKSLLDDGLEKVVNGITSLDELKRVFYHQLSGQGLSRSPVAPKR